MKKIALGIIGARSISSDFKGLLLDTGFEPAAIANPSQEIQEKARELGIKAHTDYRKILADPALEAVYICTPNYMHLEQALAAIKARKHILCEKPLGRTIKECDTIVTAAKKSGRVFQVGLELRYSEFFHQMKKILAAGEIGRVQMIWCKEFRSPFYPGFGNWRLKQDKSGGTLVEKTCHHFDIFNWMLESTPVRVAAFGGADNVYKNHPVADIIDNAWVIADYASGTRGMLGMCLCLDNYDKTEFGVVGDAGMIEGVLSESLWWSSGGTAGITKSYRANEIIVTRTKGFTRSVIEVPPAPVKQMHVGTINQWQAFADCIRNGKKPFVDVNVGRASILAPAAAEKSIKEGRVINIAD